MDAPDPGAVARTIYRETNAGTVLGVGELGDDTTMSAYCECRTGCASTIELTVSDYRAVRLRRAFVVLPGHEDGAGETVIENRGSYLVVADRHADGAGPPLPARAGAWTAALLAMPWLTRALAVNAGLEPLIAAGILAPHDLPLRIRPADPSALDGWRFA